MQVTESGIAKLSYKVSMGRGCEYGYLSEKRNLVSLSIDMVNRIINKCGNLS